MKVQVMITNSNKAAANSTTVDATVGPTDTVLNLQERVASVTKTYSFPDQKLVFNGKVLPTGQRLMECGVNEDDLLEFVFQASEQTLIKQLSELLGKQAVVPEELSLLYSYRYACSFEDALKALGHDGGLRAFLEGQKCFCFLGERVQLAQALQPPATLCPIKEDKVQRIIAANISVDVRVAGKKSMPLDEDDEVMMRLEASDTVARAMEIIAASEQTPFPQRELWLGNQKLEAQLSLDEAGVTDGSSLRMVVHASEASLITQLEDVLQQRMAVSPGDLGLLYCQRFGTPVVQALRALGLQANLKRFLEAHSEFSISAGCVTLTNGPKLTTPATLQESMDALDFVIDLICEASFLCIDRVEKGRCVAGEASATLLISGLPPSNHAPLLKAGSAAAAAALEAMRGDEPSIESASLDGDTVRVKVEGLHIINIRLAATPPRFQ